MVYRFLWVDGILDLASGYGKKHHAQMMEEMMADGRIPSDRLPDNYVAGDYMQDELHDGQFDKIKIIWEQGAHPSEQQLIQILKQAVGT